MCSPLRLAGVLILVLLVDLHEARAQPVRMTMAIDGESVEIEVRDLNRDTARELIRGVLDEMHRLRMLLSGESGEDGGVGALNGHAGGDPVPLDGQVGRALLRAQSFCIWSNGAFGPLGGRLAASLPEGGGVPTDPDAIGFGAAVASAHCANLRLTQNDSGQVTHALVAAESRVDLAGWARGFAVDLAVERLRAAGAENLWIESGPVRRGVGDGPSGQGWLAVLSFPGHAQPIDEVWLRDAALAVSLPLAPRGPHEPALRDHRSGRMVEGVVAVVAVSELAVDAEALAHSSAILGPREGRMRLAGLKPPPALLWLLGEGRGQPLRTEYRWAELPRIRKH